LKRPVGKLFEVLEGIAIFEIRVEHAVGEDGVSLASGEGVSGGDAVVLPYSIDDDSVEALVVGFEPRLEFRRVAVVGFAGAAGVDLAGYKALIGVVRGSVGRAVEGGYFDFVAGALVGADKHSYRFTGAAAVWIERVHDMQEPHRGSVYRCADLR
jgi:hypothetical protein